MQHDATLTVLSYMVRSRADGPHWSGYFQKVAESVQSDAVFKSHDHTAQGCVKADSLMLLMHSRIMHMSVWLGIIWLVCSCNELSIGIFICNGVLALLSPAVRKLQHS